MRELSVKEICFAVGLSLAKRSLAIFRKYSERAKIGQKNAFCLSAAY